MNGGTYAEALKVNFTEEQAGFLGRLGSETRDEALELLQEEITKQNIEKRNAKMNGEIFATIICAVVIAAYLVGRYFR